MYIYKAIIDTTKLTSTWKNWSNTFTATAIMMLVIREGSVMVDQAFSVTNRPKASFKSRFTSSCVSPKT